MAFTEAEKQQWHADRRAGKSTYNDYTPSLTCGHCGNPFSSGAGVATDDFSQCDACTGDFSFLSFDCAAEQATKETAFVFGRASSAPQANTSGLYLPAVVPRFIHP